MGSGRYGSCNKTGVLFEKGGMITPVCYQLPRTGEALHPKDNERLFRAVLGSM